jgi:hypothetical protein
MVSASDYPGNSAVFAANDAPSSAPRKRRFRLFAALAAPFTDMDERALHKKRARTEVRNNSKGNLLATQTTASKKVPGRRNPHGD